MRASRAHRHNLVTCTRSRAPRRSSGPPAPAVPSTARQTHLPRRSAVRRSSPDGVAADSATPRVTRTSSRLRPPRRSSARPSDLFFSRFYPVFFFSFFLFFPLFFSSFSPVLRASHSVLRLRSDSDSAPAPPSRHDTRPVVPRLIDPVFASITPAATARPTLHTDTPIWCSWMRPLQRTHPLPAQTSVSAPITQNVSGGYTHFSSFFKVHPFLKIKSANFSTPY